MSVYVALRNFSIFSLSKDIHDNFVSQKVMVENKTFK